MNIATGNQNGLVSLQKSEVETTRIIIFFLKKNTKKKKKIPQIYCKIFNHIIHMALHQHNYNHHHHRHSPQKQITQND